MITEKKEDKEEKKNDKKNENKVVLIVSSHKHEEGDSSTAGQLAKACEDRNIKHYMIDASSVNFKKIDGNKLTYDHGSDKDVTVDIDKTVALIRGGDMDEGHSEYCVNFLQNAGIHTINTLQSIKNVANKKYFADLLERYEVPTPRTWFVRNVEGLEKIENELPTFPVIVKTVRGAEGIGVVKVDKKSSLKSVLQLAWKFGSEAIIQECVNADFDIRTIVIGGKIVGAMKRIKGSNSKEFRNNYAQGGDIENYELSEEEKKIVLNAADASGCEICGVDHFVDKKGNALIIEVNSSPGTEGFSQFHSDILDQMIDYALDQVGLTSNKMVSGRIEMVEFEGIGKFRAKMDTGNSAWTVLHASDIEVDEDKKIVRFKVNGKKYKYNIVRFSRTKVGSNLHIRPIIKLNMKIGKKTLKDAYVALANRSKQETPVLISAKEIKRAQIIIDVSKDFILREHRGMGIKGYLKEMLNISEEM